MYARVTTFRVHPDKLDEARAQTEKVKSEITAIPGLQEFVIAGRDDGDCTAIAFYASEEAAHAALPQVQAVWSKYSELLASPPKPVIYDVYMHERLS